MVAREGSAPSTSGCRPDVMLFHHRAFGICDLRRTIDAIRLRSARGSSIVNPQLLIKTGCLAWICTRTVGVKTRHAAVTPRGNRSAEFGVRNNRKPGADGPPFRVPNSALRVVDWWPARVTRPVPRIKSPLHHFNACRPNWCSRQDLHLHWRRSRRRASALGYASCALRANDRWQIANSQSARRNALGLIGHWRWAIGDCAKGAGASRRCRPGRDSLQKKPAGCCMEARWPAIHSSKSEGWSQSPVLPRTRRAYETHLSAGSTAIRNSCPPSEPVSDLGRSG